MEQKLWGLNCQAVLPEMSWQMRDRNPSPALCWPGMWAQNVWHAPHTWERQRKVAWPRSRGSQSQVQLALPHPCQGVCWACLSSWNAVIVGIALSKSQSQLWKSEITMSNDKYWNNKLYSSPKFSKREWMWRGRTFAWPLSKKLKADKIGRIHCVWPMTFAQEVSNSEGASEQRNGAHGF